MWLMTSNSFLSVVAKDCPADCLLVRARVKGHIENLFPAAKVFTEDGSDYQFRAIVKRSDVGAALTGLADGIGYSNFKSSVRNHALHDAYARIWHVMAALQPLKPYAIYSKARRVVQKGLL